MIGEFQLEVYCPGGGVDDEFIAHLEKQWSQVMLLLREVGVGVICQLPELEISLLNDHEMARVHGEFLNDATPTDVITFEYGEILVGIEAAGRQAADFQTSGAREIALYGIHGMLHLAGFDDRDRDDAETMKKRQSELCAQFFPEL